MSPTSFTNVYMAPRTKIAARSNSIDFLCDFSLRVALKHVTRKVTFFRSFFEYFNLFETLACARNKDE